MLFESNLTRLEKVGVDDMSDAIWKRVYRCAEELTQQGVTPFSRGDVIRCVQRDDPSCSSDSINPVIQGITDNLRGGAPSIVGKTLFHSVERGRFVLRDATAQPVSKESANTSGYREIRALENERNRPAEISCEALLIGGYAFKYLCEIEPERNEDGTLRVSAPQCRYSNGEGLALNKYGTGPFCKFKIPWNITKSGVYAFVVNGHAKYVGECENLSKRFNMGYGNISPRNCYRGGQETNCRINTLLFESVSEGLKVALWFHETYDYKKVESDLRAQEKFEWNRA